jgi:hypothetical protein
VVFHCGGGKDRTGLLALVLLTLAGAPPEEIIADYLLTYDRLKQRYDEIGVRDQLTAVTELRGGLPLNTPGGRAVAGFAGPWVGVAAVTAFQRRTPKEAPWRRRERLQPSSIGTGRYPVDDHGGALRRRKSCHDASSSGCVWPCGPVLAISRLSAEASASKTSNCPSRGKVSSSHCTW